MKLSKLTLIAVSAFALALSACGGSSASTETAKTRQSSSGSNSTGTTQPKTETKTAMLKQSTPSEAGESFFNIIKAKDAAGFKQLMSKDSLELLDAAAKEKKMTLDELLNKEFFPNTQIPDKWEQRNEKITGEKAVVEVKNEKGEWTPMSFVRESGAWKASLE